MKKRRKVWWIVSSGAFVFMFIVVAIFQSANTQDARLEATLAEILEKYSSDQQFEQHGFDQTRKIFNDDVETGSHMRAYTLPQLSLEEIEDIASAIKGECGAGIYEAYGTSGDKIWLLNFDERYSIHTLVISQDAQVYLRDVSSEPSSVIVLWDGGRVSLLKRILGKTDGRRVEF